MPFESKSRRRPSTDGESSGFSASRAETSAPSAAPGVASRFGHDFADIGIFAPPARAPGGPDAAPGGELENFRPDLGPTDAGLAPGGAGPAVDEVQAFIDHGLYGPKSLVPPTNIGGFDAIFDPAEGVLVIEVDTGINFQDGLSLDAAGNITANHTDLNQAATDGMNLPVADRAAFVGEFTWTEAQKAEFTAALETRINAAWGGQFAIMCRKPGFERIGCVPQIFVVAHEGAVTETDHMQTTAYKVPEDGTYSVGAFVDSHNDQDAHNNEMTISSTDVNPTPLDQSLLRKQVFFANNSATLDANAQATLNQFAIDFQDANLDLSNPVQLIGRASSTGTAAHNLALSQRRVDAVKQHLQSVGFTGLEDRVSSDSEGEEGATEAAEWRRVDLIVGSGEGQLVAAHEFGHVFGLDDEYSVNPGGGITGTGLPVGTVVGHDAMAKALGVGGAVAENNDDIMSLGNTVRPKHYATFGWAMQQLTGIQEWGIDA